MRWTDCALRSSRFSLCLVESRHGLSSTAYFGTGCCWRHWVGSVGRCVVQGLLIFDQVPRLFFDPRLSLEDPCVIVDFPDSGL